MRRVVLGSVGAVVVLGAGLASAAWRGTADEPRNRLAMQGEGVILANGGSGEAASILGEWRVTWIAFATLPPDVPILLRFAPGRVHGLAGCSNFEGTLGVDGVSLAFGPLESDGAECAPEWMKAASDFLRVLSQSDRYDLGPDGRLKLSGAGIATVEAVR